ncbi:uncharacterized protein LOC127284355 [Leptopilina boulardi]|uniref:uncharacterized protein LOC127284355 n=1 Tax=Leptopilina boulardi TaxID=63433 RepID=UPI0021F52246|nr:uncharacterized protein LOC127284355 [Leptopilina boulardi]
MEKAETAVLRVVKWMKSRKLTLAPEKTEAVLLTNKTKLDPIEFDMQGVKIKPGNYIKQLGVWIDKKLTFKEHVNKVLEKAEKTMSVLASLMPNIKGPSASKRKILVSVVHSQILYDVPVWVRALKIKEYLKKLIRLQKVMGIRVCSGYRTISASAVGVIADIPPIELLAYERKDVYEWKTKEEAKSEMLARWQEKWDGAQHGR